MDLGRNVCVSYWRKNFWKNSWKNIWKNTREILRKIKVGCCEEASGEISEEFLEEPHNKIPGPFFERIPWGISGETNAKTFVNIGEISKGIAEKILYRSLSERVSRTFFSEICPQNVPKVWLFQEFLQELS